MFDGAILRTVRTLLPAWGEDAQRTTGRRRGTLIAVGHVDGIHEGNPLSAAGQALLGSTPVFMVATTALVTGLLTILAVRPVNAPTRLLWWALALLGAAKIAVAILNLVVLQGALDATVDVF
jgi:hypothetical protein